MINLQELHSPYYYRILNQSLHFEQQPLYADIDDTISRWVLDAINTSARSDVLTPITYVVNKHIEEDLVRLRKDIAQGRFLYCMLQKVRFIGNNINTVGDEYFHRFSFFTSYAHCCA